MLLHESDIRALNPAIDVHKARVFRNINHITFVTGKPPHRGSPLVRDELNPEQPEQLIFDWMLADLLAACDHDQPTAEASTERN
jgi:hypothetical protein